MEKEQIGAVTLYMADGAAHTAQTSEDVQRIREIVQQYNEKDYHTPVTEAESWEVMYQLAEPRGNVVEWLDIAPGARVLELSAGCGTLSSVLLKKGAALTCVEENVHYCRINAMRHKDAAGLTVYAQSAEAFLAQSEQSYDWIIFIGALATAREGLLLCLRQHLAAGGRLVLATENKFGLKYWAGNKEGHTGVYFAGLENETGAYGVRTYTRRGLEQLLAENGYGTPQFFYPYPDYRFALNIYSDSYLPKKGELSNNIVNYDGDRIVLFDEQKVFDSIIEEGQFPLFANSYLCIAGSARLQETAQPDTDKKKQTAREQIVYTRYASDRARAYAIRTDILVNAENPQTAVEKAGENTAGCEVRKYPMYQEGAAHIAHIARAYELLGQQYRDTDLRFNRCRLLSGGAGASFAFIDGYSLQNEVEQAAASHDYTKVFDILARLMQYIRSDAKSIPFAVTDEFRRVFGGVGTDALHGAWCSSVSDIDLILANILVDKDGAWHVIDYEWTFFFPVPHNFIIYRTLFFLVQEHPGNEELSMERLLAFADIAEEEAEVYAAMEAGFQQYVTGAQTPYREMVNLLGRKFFNVTQLQQDYERIAAQNELLKGRGIWKLARAVKKKLKHE